MRTTRTTLAHFLIVLACAITPVAWSDPAGDVIVNADGITYSARSGDTLISIAQRFTSRGGNWIALGKVNRIDKDSNIPVGTPILIPAELLADEPTQAHVKAFSGNVQLRDADGTAIPTTVGTRLGEGMQIETGNNSFVSIGLADESRISVPSNSAVKLTRLRKTFYTGSPRTELTLLRGRVESRVTPLETRRGKFEVRTPRSVAAVRGTHFRVRLAEDNIATEVLEGQVATAAADTQAKVSLGAAKGNISSARDVGRAYDLLPPPRLAGMPRWEKGVGAQFDMAALAGAVGYHIELARDPEGIGLLAETSAATRRLTIGDVAEGDYYVRMTAFDQRGLEGMPRTEAVHLKAGDRNAARNLPLQGPPQVAGSDSRELVLRWPSHPGSKYILQLARDLDFSWLQFTGTVEGNQARLPRPPFGVYYARVQSLNADGSSNPFSLAQAVLVTDQWIIDDGDPIAVRERSAPSR